MIAGSFSPLFTLMDVSIEVYQLVQNGGTYNTNHNARITNYTQLSVPAITGRAHFPVSQAF